VTPPRWRVVVVDDEPPARDTLRLLLASDPDFTIVAECAHGEEAIAVVRRESPDVLFLDVQMPGLDGFDVLRTLAAPAAAAEGAHYDWPVAALVFVTAYDRYALRAFETHALDYLLKPFSDERFTDVLRRVKGRLREKRLADTGRRLTALLESSAPRVGPQQLIVRDSGRTLVIPYDEILWIEAEDYYVRIHARQRRTLARVSLKSLADELDADRFVRVHRSAIVNVACVREVEPLASGDQRLLLSDGTELRVSRTYRAALEERLGRR
jgi:two-component system, LytTR family, response regulator